MKTIAFAALVLLSAQAVAQAPAGEPVWEVVEAYLKVHRSVAPKRENSPKLLGVDGNPGVAW